MHRTQVYLTDEERKAIQALARQSGKSFSATLRDAIDDYIAKYRTEALSKAIEASYGCWRDRDDLTLEALRHEWDAREDRLR